MVDRDESAGSGEKANGAKTGRASTAARLGGTYPSGPWLAHAPTVARATIRNAKRFIMKILLLDLFLY